ncbi:MAG: PAS domain-containing protein [Gemmatimonadota bacterium]
MDAPSRYEKYFQAMSGYVTVQDRDLHIVDANDRFRQDFGEWEGRYCYQVYKRRADRCEVCPVARTFQDGERHDSEERVRTQDGREVSTIVYTKPIRDDDGRMVSVMEVSTDITHIKDLQGKLRRSEQRYRTLFDEVPCYISIQDADLNIVDANRAFQEAFGNCLGCKCFQAYKHRTEPCVPCPVQETLEDGLSHSREEVVRDLTGSQRNVLVTTAPIRDPGGELVGVMEMSADITEVRELEDRLTSLGLLVGSVSHGLKGLLNGLSGGMYLVDSGFASGNDDRVERGWATVHRNVDRIKAMVSDILYYAKDRTPMWESLDAVEVAEEVVEMLQPRLAERDVELVVAPDPDVGEFEGDGQAIRAMLANLVENALDACRLDRKDGPHRVALRVGGTPAEVRFDVEDDGVGMDRETVEKAFTLFFSSKGSGTGLGLFIAHKITQSHGGRIDLESVPGEGTHVAVALPRRRPTLPASDQAGPEQGNSHDA